MNLGRFFSLFAATALLLMLGMGAGLYAIAWHRARASDLDNARVAAEMAARQLERLTSVLTAAVERSADDPALGQALADDPVALRTVEARLSRSLPGALLVRVLPDSVEALDQSRSPQMGYADLDTVREAKTGKPQPALHEANSPNAHLALARHLGYGNGVLLASLSPKLLGGLLRAPDGAALELRQHTLSLTYDGDTSLKRNDPNGESPVAGTPWTVAYRVPVSVSAGGLWFLAATGTATVLLAVAATLAYRWLRGALRQDMESILELVKDLFAGTAHGTYPLRLHDLENLTTQLLKLRRMAPAAAAPARAAAPPVITSQLPTAEVAVGDTEKPFPVPASLFGAGDIRGTVGDPLTPALIQRIGRAIGSEAREQGDQRVAVAHDGRLSGPELSTALAKGLMESGCSVIDLGLAPTPVLYFATHTLGTRSGVMVTGSHNAANVNGLKIVIGGETLGEVGIGKLRTRIESNDYSRGTGQLEKRRLIPEYIDHVVQDAQIGRALKVVVDCGNGAASEIAPALLGELGCEVVPLFCTVDGNFPNHPPDPGKAENLKALVEKVTTEHADLGIAFDGGADSLGVVDSSGRIIRPDRQLMLFAADVLSREPGADIIYDVKCTRHLAGYIVRHGGRPLMWKTGHALIKAKIDETGAMLAGELSGHIYFKERWYGFDDGIYAGARLVEILSGDPRSTAEVFAELPDSVSTPELNIVLPEGENSRMVEQLRAAAQFSQARIVDIDGLRVDFVDGFGLIRASNTTPSLVIRFEADTQDAMARIQSDFKSLMQKVKPGLAIPF